MSFSLTMKNAVFFKRLVTALSVLEEPVFRVDKERLFVRQMDKTHSCLTHLEVSSKSFQTYSCEKPDTIKVQRDELLNCLKKVSENQYISLSITEENPDKLTVTVSEKSIKDFTVPLFNLDDEDKILPPQVTKATSSLKIKMDASALKDSVAELKGIIGEHDMVEIRAVKDTLMLIGKGDKRGLTVTHMNGTDILSMETRLPVTTSHFGIVYLNAIVEDPSPLSGVVIIEFGQDMPLKLTYELPFEGSLYYFLAPRIEVTV